MVQKPGHELREHIAVLQPLPVLGEGGQHFSLASLPKKLILLATRRNEIRDSSCLNTAWRE